MKRISVLLMIMLAICLMSLGTGSAWAQNQCSVWDDTDLTSVQVKLAILHAILLTNDCDLDQYTDEEVDALFQRIEDGNFELCVFENLLAFCETGGDMETACQTGVSSDPTECELCYSTLLASVGLCEGCSTCGTIFSPDMDSETKESRWHTAAAAAVFPVLFFGFFAWRHRSRKQ